SRKPSAHHQQLLIDPVNGKICNKSRSLASARWPWNTPRCRTVSPADARYDVPDIDKIEDVAVGNIVNSAWNETPDDHHATGHDVTAPPTSGGSRWSTRAPVTRLRTSHVRKCI